MLEKMSAIAAVVGGSGDGERDARNDDDDCLVRFGLAVMVTLLFVVVVVAFAFLGDAFGFGEMATSGGENLMSLLRKFLKSVSLLRKLLKSAGFFCDAEKADVFNEDFEDAFVAAILL